MNAPAARPTTTTSTDGEPLTFAVHGDAGRTPILTTHGLVSSSHHWRFFTPHYAATRPVLSWEYRGHGGLPAPRAPVTDPRGEMFRILLESHRLAGPMLAADTAATKGREYYDDGFYEAFRKGAFPTVDQRVADSIAASAAFIAGAWDTAGRPAVPTTLTRPPRRVPVPAPPK